MNEEATSKKENRRERFILRITSATSYSLPFLTTLPNLTWWMGIMTLPLFLYIYLILVGGPENPIPIPNLADPAMLVIITCVIIALLFLVWSIVNLHRKKVSGLVTSGPYRYVRHPQYLAFIILTGIMTHQSVWILQNTFGIGWLSVDQTKLLWLLMLSAYVVIGVVEEMHLQKNFDDEWSEYRNRVGFLIPFVKYKSYVVEMLSGIIIPYAILEILLYMTL